MRPLKSATALFFMSAAVIMNVVLLRAEPRIDCMEHTGCYPPWGAIVGPSGCWFIDMTCINAAETCEQFCDTLGGVQIFTCDGSDGWCNCLDAEYCMECLLDPESC